MSDDKLTIVYETETYTLPFFFFNLLFPLDFTLQHLSPLTNFIFVLFILWFVFPYPTIM